MRFVNFLPLILMFMPFYSHAALIEYEFEEISGPSSISVIYDFAEPLSGLSFNEMVSVTGDFDGSGAQVFINSFTSNGAPFIYSPISLEFGNFFAGGVTLLLSTTGVELALSPSGPASFDILFNRGPGGLVSNYSTVGVFGSPVATGGNPVPAPPVLALISIGLLGLFRTNRRKS